MMMIFYVMQVVQAADPTKGGDVVPKAKRFGIVQVV
jgi:hypothetical protein